MALTALGISNGPTSAPVETRGAGNYTDQILSSAYAAATGRIHAASVAGVQAAAGIVGRALASAVVEGDGGAVDPFMLEAVGTDLVRSGRFLGRLTVGPGGRVRILRACAAPSVTYGNSDPESWIYWLQEGGPSEARTVRAVASEVVNVRINSDSRRPWEGIAPLARAVASGQLAARLASSLGDEADVVVSRIIPIAQGAGEGAANQLTQALTGRLPGRVVWPETQLAGAGAGRSSAPMRDFGSTRTGFESPISGPTLYAHLFSEVAEICGVPGALVNPASAGPAAREAWRRLTVGTCEPFARMIESELSRVLERTVTITLRRLGGVDAAGRARALHVLTEAGFTPEAAQELLGWD